MGLDITSYIRIKYISPNRGDDEPDDTVYLYVNKDFISQADGLKTGLYKLPLSRPYMNRFRAGSYSYYSTWRNWLASLVGTSPERIWQSNKPGPFVEIINFSDCEGVIGPKTSEKLYNDFLNNFDAAITSLSKVQDKMDRIWYIQTYINFMNAFGNAKHDGAVQFH